MRPRHAAALALVGWYLMLPPIVNDQPDTTQPLNTWDIWRSFDTATGCEENRDFKAKQMRETFKKNAVAAEKWATIFGVDSKCIGTDDPRLKDK